MTGKDEKKKVSLLSRIKRGFEAMARWMHRVVTDDDAVEIIRTDLGLEPLGAVGQPKLSSSQKERLDQIIQDKLEKDQELDDLSPEEQQELKAQAREQLVTEASTAQAFAETAQQIEEMVEIIRVMIEVIDDDQLTGRDLLWAMTGLFGAGWLETSTPAGHALMQIFGLVTSDDHAVLQTIEPSPLFALLDGDDDAIDAFIERLANVAMIATGIVDVVVGTEEIPPAPGDDGGEEKEVRDRFPAFTGWDPAPDDDPLAADIASRTTTITLPLIGDSEANAPRITLVPVRRSEGGPGALLAVSAGFEFGIRAASARVDTGAATSFYIGAREVESDDPDEPEFEFRYEFFGPVQEPVVELRGTSDPDVPALFLGSPVGTRFELGAFDWRLGAGDGRAFAGAAVREGRVVVELSDGDSFLRSLVGGRFELEFDIEAVWDTDDGFRFRDGSGLGARLPLRRALFGVFVLQYAELCIEVEGPVIEVAAGVAFDLGLFRASLDRVGFDFRPAIDGRPAEFGKLLPPSGVGLVVDSGPVRGGGSLYVDRDAGEYGGVLELAIGSWGLKAIGLISTRRPDGGDGTSMLFMIFLEFELHLAFGIFWTGAGGVVGIDHEVDVPALESGLKTGALDDLLFPEHPVADAPRLLTRYRQLYPIAPGRIVAGLALEFSFGKPAVGVLRLGVIAEIEDRSVRDWLLVGLLTVRQPDRTTGARPYLQLIVDVIGGHDSAQGRTVVRGGLRDSFVGPETGPRFTLAGEFVFVRWRPDPDTSPIWAGSLGGWHPEFDQVPPGLPATLDQVEFGFKLGPVRMAFTFYFAITPETVQIGFSFDLKAKLGPASLTAHLSVDALINRDTKQFRALITFKAGVKIWGRGLTVEIEGQLEGPSQWAFQGTAKIKILFKTFKIDIDEQEGRLPALDSERVDVVALVVAEMSRPANLVPELPTGESALVTLAEPDDATDLAHPLASLTIDQVVAPFDVRIERVGERLLDAGPMTLRITSASVGGRSQPRVERTHGDFAIGQFVDVAEDERLSRRSFDRLPNGVRIGDHDVVLPKPSTHAQVTIEHETRRLGRPEAPRPDGIHWDVIAVGLRTLDFELASSATRFGAAGRTSRDRAARLVRTVEPAQVSDPALVAVAPDDLRPAASFVGGVSSPFQATTALADGADLLVVPEFDLEETP